MTANDYGVLLQKASRRRYFVWFVISLSIANIPQLISLFADYCQLLSLDTKWMRTIVIANPLIKLLLHPIAISCMILVGFAASVLSATLFFNDIKRRHYGRLQLTLKYINDLSDIIHKKFYDYFQRQGRITTEELQKDFMEVCNEIPKSLSSLLSKLCNTPISVHLSIISGLQGLGRKKCAPTEFKDSKCIVQSISVFQDGEKNPDITNTYEEVLVVSEGYWYNRLNAHHKDTLAEANVEKLQIPDGLVLDGPTNGSVFIGKIIIKVSIQREEEDTCVGFLRIHGGNHFFKHKDDEIVVRGIFQQYAYKTAMFLEKMNFMIHNINQDAKKPFVKCHDHRFSNKSSTNKNKKNTIKKGTVKHTPKSSSNSHPIRSKRKLGIYDIFMFWKEKDQDVSNLTWNKKH